MNKELEKVIASLAMGISSPENQKLAERTLTKFTNLIIEESVKQANESNA